MTIKSIIPKDELKTYNEFCYNSKNKKKFLIGVSRFKNYIKHDCDKLRSTSITVYATDEVEAIQMHNEIFDNYKDVENYVIIGNGKITEALQKVNK